MNPETLFLGVFGGEAYTWAEAIDWDYYYLDLQPDPHYGFAETYLSTVTALT